MFMFKKKRSPEDSLNSAHTRERIGQLLRVHYQACMTEELPPRLLAVLKKLDGESELSAEHGQATPETRS